MKKNYKENQKYLGCSDIASLVAVGGKCSKDFKKTDKIVFRKTFHNNYKDFTLEPMFTNVDYLKTNLISFGADGEYFCYIIDENYEVPNHYKLIDTYTNWLKIYDDEELTFKIYAPVIAIYRAGIYGLIIRIIGKSLDEK